MVSAPLSSGRGYSLVRGLAAWLRGRAAEGRAQSKTLRAHAGRRHARQRLGVRQPSGAWGRAERFGWLARVPRDLSAGLQPALGVRVSGSVPI